MNREAIREPTLDLPRLTTDLEERFRHNPPLGYLQGRTEIRDVVVHLLGCSFLEAELAVDRLESEGFIEYEGDATGSPASPDRWSFGKSAATGPHPIATD